MRYLLKEEGEKVVEKTKKRIVQIPCPKCKGAGGTIGNGCRWCYISGKISVFEDNPLYQDEIRKAIAKG